MITFILDILLYGFCHWVGVVTVKAITFGKVDLSDEDPSEFFFIEWIGVGVVLVIAVLAVFLINEMRDPEPVTPMTIVDPQSEAGIRPGCPEGVRQSPAVSLVPRSTTG